MTKALPSVSGRCLGRLEPPGHGRRVSSFSPWNPFPKRSTSLRPGAQGDQEEGDIIERFVSKIFGSKVLQDQSPGGLKRLDNPEMYTAPTDRFADQLESDSGDIKYAGPTPSCRLVVSSARWLIGSTHDA
jgi:hypothetical protein